MEPQGYDSPNVEMGALCSEGTKKLKRNIPAYQCMGLFCGCVKVFVWRRKSEKMGDVSLKNKMFCLKKNIYLYF